MSDAEKLARAVLLFHRGGQWTDQDRETWLAWTGEKDATAVTLCNLARRVRFAADRFECPRCGAISFHPRDITERYCGRCHVFVDDP